MGVYARVVLPRLIEFAMGSGVVAQMRKAVVPDAAGRVLEVGLGSGLNIPFYGPAVDRLTGLDPSVELWRLAGRRVAQAPFPVAFLRGSAERIPCSDATFDTVVTTWSLCSIPDPAAAVAEMWRVLVPGGRLLFTEHGRSPDARIRAWQQRIEPIWSRVAGGCHLTRPVADLIRAAGFLPTRLDARYGAGPRVFSYQWSGVATRPH